MSRELIVKCEARLDYDELDHEIEYAISGAINEAVRAEVRKIIKARRKGLVKLIEEKYGKAIDEVIGDIKGWEL